MRAEKSRTAGYHHPVAEKTIHVFVIAMLKKWIRIGWSRFTGERAAKPEGTLFLDGA